MVRFFDLIPVRSNPTTDRSAGHGRSAEPQAVQDVVNQDQYSSPIPSPPIRSFYAHVLFLSASMLDFQ